MEKWPPSESSFKRISASQTENGSVEEAKKIYESPSVEELQNRLADQLKRKETSGRKLINSLFLTGAFAGILGITALLLAIRVGGLQGQNRMLTGELDTLKTQIKTLETENKQIRSQITMAERERDDLKGRLADATQVRLKLENELRDNQTIVGNANEEKTYLEEILIHKTKEIEELRKNAPTAASVAVSQDARDLASQLREKDAELARLTEQNRILSNRIEKLYRVTNEKISEINVAKIALEETIAQARKNIENEWSTVDLGAIQAGQKSASAPSAGQVLAVNDEHGFIVVNLGRTHGMTAQTRLIVRQNGDGIATLSPLEIRDVMTACNIKEIQSGRKIAVSDPVSIQK